MGERLTFRGVSAAQRLAEIEEFVGRYRTAQAVRRAYPWIDGIHSPALALDPSLAGAARARVTARKAAQVLYDLPRKVLFEVTAECPLECHYCLIRDSFSHRTRRALSFEDFLAAWRGMAAFTDDVELSGGEPFLNDDIFRILAEIRRSGASAVLFTNAQLLDEERVARLLESPPLLVNIAYDGTTPEEYEGVRRGGRFDRLQENVARLTEAKRRSGSRLPIVEPQMIVTRKTIGSIDRFWSQARALGADRARLKPVLVNPHATPEFRRRMIDEFLVPDGRMSYHVLDAAGELARTKRPGHCVQRDSVTIGTGGEVIPCRSLTRTPFVFGSAAEDPFLDLWFRDDYVRHRRLMEDGVDPACQYCNLNHDPSLYVEKWISDVEEPYHYDVDSGRVRDLVPIDRLVSLERYSVRNVRALTRGRPMVVETRSRRWHYALTFPLDLSRLPDDRSAPVMISLAGWVERGEIGVGLVEADGATYVHEIRMGPRSERVAFDFFPGNPRRCSALVVRNVAEGGATSRAIIESVNAYRYRRA